MNAPLLPNIDQIPFGGPDTNEVLAFRHYEPERMVLGKPMAEHLRMAVCYWHSFCWGGEDVFGGPVFARPWLQPGLQPGEPMAQARVKLAAAFELFEKLSVPYFTFHDRDLAPDIGDLRDLDRSLSEMAELTAAAMERTGVKLLWGTANLTHHPRYAAGAATNPDPEVFACAAAQVARCMEVTHQLGGENYVLWGGREGYDTLLNTDMGRELDQLGRFMTMVVDHKHRIGFSGTILIEPKPMEPTKHQYDYDAAAVNAFLRRYGLQDDIKLNIEVNHATLAGHTFEHELTYAISQGIFGSVDINRGDPQLGWDTDQFPNSVEELTPAMLALLRGGGFTTGGFNFDAKLRRQSLDAEDLLHGHIGGMDTLALALLGAERLIEDGGLQAAVERRYAGWQGPLGQRILDGGHTLASLKEQTHARGLDPQPVSGRQERLENLVQRVGRVR